MSHAEARTITADSLPSWVVDLPTRTVVSVGSLDVRAVFLVVVVIVALLAVAMQRLRWGRRLYAIGSNPEAAVQAGLPTRRLVFGAFVACGALSGLAGFLFLARFGTITVVAGQGLELDSVAAAVVGGVSVLGGSGTLVGALLGAVIIDVLDQSLVRVPQVSEFWRNAILGALILAGGDRRRRHRPAVPPAVVGRGQAPHQGHRGRAGQIRPRRWRRPMPEWTRERTWEVLLAVILVGTVVYNASQSPVYLDVDNFVNLFRLSIEKVIVAVIMTFVIVNGEIDLSVASVMAFSACVLGAAYEAGVPFPLAIVLALAASAAGGFLQGQVIARTGISSLVVTLAGLIGFRGAARILLEDRSVGDVPGVVHRPRPRRSARPDAVRAGAVHRVASSWPASCCTGPPSDARCS